MPIRIIWAIESICSRLGEIQDERLTNAALKFYFLRMKDVLDYVRTNKSSIDDTEYHKVKDLLYNSEPIKNYLQQRICRHLNVVNDCILV